jgi:hypothetical protein
VLWVDVLPAFLDRELTITVEAGRILCTLCITTSRYIPEENNPHSHNPENLKSHKQKSQYNSTRENIKELLCSY